MSITPNGGRILQHWGFDSVKAGGIQNLQVRKPKGDTLAPIAPTVTFADVEQQYGAKWYLYHRVDMHRQLREMAERVGAVIRLGCQVIDLDPEEGVLKFKDMSTKRKDLIIVADGQHDRLNERITGRNVPMERSGQTAYRCMIPMKDILDDEVTRPLFANEAPGFWAPVLPAKGVMAVTYPCRNNTILNVIAVHRKMDQHTTSEDDIDVEDWNFPATHEDLERILDGFHPSVQRLFLKAPEVKVYTQMKRQPLDRMTKGRAILIGDACHPMLLTHAQGVSSSIEDAAALEVFLADLPPSSSGLSQALTSRLQLLEEFRLPRVSATQILTEPIPPGPKLLEMSQKQEALIRQYYPGPLPATGSMPHSPSICQFFFGYDVRKEARQFMLDHAPRLPAVSPSMPRDSDSMIGEAQRALAAAQLALVQVTQTLAAAQQALDMALRSARSQDGSFTPPPIPQESASSVQAPRRLKSLENLKSRLSLAWTKKAAGGVKEAQLTPPDTPPETQNASAVTSRS